MIKITVRGITIPFYEFAAKQSKREHTYCARGKKFSVNSSISRDVPVKVQKREAMKTQEKSW